VTGNTSDKQAVTYLLQRFNMPNVNSDDVIP